MRFARDLPDHFFLDCSCGRRLHWRGRPYRAILLEEEAELQRPSFHTIRCDCNTRYPFPGQMVEEPTLTRRHARA